MPSSLYHPLVPRGRYDAATHFWTEMHGCFQTAMLMLGVKGTKGHPSARVMTHYWGCHQRFFRQMCMAVKVPEVVRVALEALADNKCVVIGLQTTGESRLNDAVKRGDGTPAGLDPSTWLAAPLLPSACRLCSPRGRLIESALRRPR